MSLSASYVMRVRVLRAKEAAFVRQMKARGAPADITAGSEKTVALLDKWLAKAMARHEVRP
jgi:hypothetical protein